MSHQGNKPSWDPEILATAFNDEAWHALAHEAQIGSSRPLSRDEIVSAVAHLPWHVVTGAVQHGVGSVPWKGLIKALRRSAEGLSQHG